MDKVPDQEKTPVLTAERGLREMTWNETRQMGKEKYPVVPQPTGGRDDTKEAKCIRTGASF